MCKDKIITIKVNDKMRSQLKDLADKDRRNMSSYIRMILDKVITGEITP